MDPYNPEFAEKPFAFDFASVDYNHKPPKLKSLKCTAENFKHIVKMFSVLYEIVDKKVKWSAIPTTPLLYSGEQAKQIKAVKDDAVKRVIQKQFLKQSRASVDDEYYPSYLSITKEMRLFGYQWEGVFNIVLIDFNHSIIKRS